MGLAALCVYLAEHRSADDAEALLDALLKRVESLERFPERGAVPKELAALGIRAFRQILHRPYRLIYQVLGKRVFCDDGRRWTPRHAGAAIAAAAGVGGYEGPGRSPDRADAMVWALWELLLGPQKLPPAVRAL